MGVEEVSHPGRLTGGAVSHRGFGARQKNASPMPQGSTAAAYSRRSLLMRLHLVLPVVLLGLSSLACGSSKSDTTDPNTAQNQYGVQGQPGQYTPPGGQQP